MGTGLKYRLVLCVTVLLVATGFGGVACSEATAPEELPTTTSSSTSTTSTTLDAGLDYSLTFSSYLPESASLWGTYLTPWMEEVSDASNGRVTFDVSEPDGLPKDYATVLREVLAGTTDLTVFEADYVPGEYPLLELASLPMLVPNTEVAARVTLQLIEEYGDEEFEGLQVLGFMAPGPRQYGGTVPVRVPKDFEGLRILSLSDLDSEIITALGGIVEPWDVAQGTTIPRRDFSGIFLPWLFHAGNTNQWAEYWTTCDLCMYNPLLLVMNKDKWDSLPAAVQQAFTDNSGAGASAAYLVDEAKYEYDNSLLPELEDRGLDYLAVKARAREIGHPIYILSDEERAEWREALQPVWRHWVDTYIYRMPSYEILNRALELVEEYSAD